MVRTSAAACASSTPIWGASATAGPSPPPSLRCRTRAPSSSTIAMRSRSPARRRSVYPVPAGNRQIECPGREKYRRSPATPVTCTAARPLRQTCRWVCGQDQPRQRSNGPVRWISSGKPDHPDCALENSGSDAPTGTGRPLIRTLIRDPDMAGPAYNQLLVRWSLKLSSASARCKRSAPRFERPAARLRPRRTSLRSPAIPRPVSRAPGTATPPARNRRCA